jgi:hypothetical protein
MGRIARDQLKLVPQPYGGDHRVSRADRAADPFKLTGEMLPWNVNLSRP